MKITHSSTPYSFTRLFATPWVSYNLLAVVAFSILFFLRVYQSVDIGLHDYDAVKNYLVAKSIARGNFNLLFHHAAPLLHLFDAIAYVIFKSHLAMVYAEAILQLLAVFWLTHFLKNKYHLCALETFFLTLFVGSFPLLVYTGRCITVDNGNLVFIFVAVYYLVRKNTWLFSLFFLVAFAFNYKSVLILPFCMIYVVLEAFTPQRNALSAWRKLLHFLLLFGGINLLAVTFWSMLSWVLIGKVTGYLGNLYYLFFEAHHRKVSGEAWVEFDFFYYFKFLFFFENPLLWIALLIFLRKSYIYLKRISIEKLFSILEQYPFLMLLFSVALPTMLLEKAPRVWVMVLIIGYAYTFVSISSLHRWLKYVLLFGFFFNVYYSQRFIYQYAQSNYPKVATYLKDNQIPQVTLIGSLQAVVFLEDEKVKYQKINHLTSLSPKVSYILTDDYCTLADECVDTNQLILVKEWQEQTLSDPYLYFEHSQYLGLDFWQSYTLWKKQKRKPTSTYLYKLEQ